jgi:hypothetical protein
MKEVQNNENYHEDYSSVVTYWNKAISWTKFNQSMNCQRQLQNTILGMPSPDFIDYNYYAVLGIIVQRVFEVYFNRRLNIQNKYRNAAFYDKLIERVWSAMSPEKDTVIYRDGETLSNLNEEVIFLSHKGFKTFSDMGVLGCTIDSEVPWRTCLRGLTLFSKVDFVHETFYGIKIFDGKSNKARGILPDQLLFNSLTALGSSKTVISAGYVYWRSGFSKEDVSAPALKTFKDTKLLAQKPLFDSLQKGIKHALPTSPSLSKCRFCKWGSLCSDSLYPSAHNTGD